ncbi:hypothetical protein [Proteiniborus ethanoligenes]|uniref:hypothetical protein n=1 Tax=Proteiniborus ethanoligenes TaxID=415015 RepID=UPI001AD8CC6E|nr:hypothetical protein [Proteiniborus ethanoligenes]
MLIDTDSRVVLESKAFLWNRYLISPCNKAKDISTKVLKKGITILITIFSFIELMTGLITSENADIINRERKKVKKEITVFLVRDILDLL